MRLSKLFIFALAGFIMISCVNDSNSPNIDEPETYTFTRNGESTVSFSGQTTRIQMAEELVGSMTDFDNATETSLLRMYRNATEDGGDADPFSDPSLNEASKNIKGKVAASEDFFADNTTASAELKAQFETWISSQVNEVFPNENTEASKGQAGQIPDGSSTRYVDAHGLELNQLVAKGLIGALMTDQMLNNYLSTSVLDAGTNREDNDNEVTEEGKNYTSMEHKWDEAYGYLYGNAQDPANPNATLGDDDSFLNKYLARVDNDEDFAGIAEEVFNAFKRGRAAIVAGAYDVRDEQAALIRENISKMLAIRAVYYLQAGKTELEKDNPNYGSAFHSLSEGYGFVFSLQFTRLPGAKSPYYPKTDVETYLDSFFSDGDGALWTLTPETLDQVSVDIASAFDFTVEQAAN